MNWRGQRTGIGDARAVTLSPPGASAGGCWPPGTPCADVFPNFARSTAVPHTSEVRAQRNRDVVHSLWTTLSTPVDNVTQARRRTSEKQRVRSAEALRTLVGTGPAQRPGPFSWNSST